MAFADNFQCIMCGGLARLELNDLLFFLDKMGELNINTLLVQKGLDGRYICKVDELTSKAFIEKFPIAPHYEVDKCFE